VVVFLSPEAAGTAADLQRVYPQAEVAGRRAPDVAEPLLYAVHIPARAIKAAGGRPTAAD
jgi:hypothetical protein